MIPVKSGFSSTWATTEDDKFEGMLAREGFGCWTVN